MFHVNTYACVCDKGGHNKRRFDDDYYDEFFDQMSAITCMCLCLYVCLHWRRLVKTIKGQTKIYRGAKGESIGVSQLLGAHARAAPQLYTYVNVYIIICLFVCLSMCMPDFPCVFSLKPSKIFANISPALNPHPVSI